MLGFNRTHRRYGSHPSRARSGLWILVIVCALASFAGADPRNNALFERLAEHVKQQDTLDDKARGILLDALAARTPDDDDESLIIEVLALLSDKFRAGLDAFDDDDYEACIEVMDALADDPDSFVRFNARSYTAKARVHLGRLVEAQERIEALLAQAEALADHSLDEPELFYMLGYCQVQNVEYDKARATLNEFLREFPDASPRFIVTAKQMLAELDRRIPESMGEVADLMDFSEQRLLAGDPGDRTQTTQDRVIELLDKLIEEIEEQEKKSQGGAPQSSRGKRRQQQEQQQLQSQPNQPMLESQATPGTPPSGGARPGRVVNPGDAWGAMPEAERDRILQVLRDRFPGRYRALVEQYYESLAEQP